jgi:hypothetical protein
MYSIGGPDGPVYFYTDANGYIVRVGGQRLDVNGSPLIITPDPPLGPIDSVDFGSLYRTIIALVG